MERVFKLHAEKNVDGSIEMLAAKVLGFGENHAAAHAWIEERLVACVKARSERENVYLSLTDSAGNPSKPACFFHDPDPTRKLELEDPTRPVNDK
jgi:hypothetical protein